MIPLSTSSTRQLFLTFPILAPRLQTPHVMVASIRRLIMTGRLLGTAARGPLAILQHWRARRAMHLPRLMSKASSTVTPAIYPRATTITMDGIVIPYRAGEYTSRHRTAAFQQ